MNNQIEPKFRLKKPTLVFILAAGFSLAPFANLAIPLMMGGHKSWYNPMVWWTLLMKLPLVEQVLLLSIAVAGVLLFFQRKASWFGAVVILLMVSAYNISIAQTPSGAGFLNTLNLLINGGILIVFYFFRFPYLDKRDHILKGYAERHHVSIETLIDGKHTATIKNISDTGCYFEFTDKEINVTAGQKIELVFTKPSVQALTGQVGHVGKGVGVRFLEMSGSQKKFVQDIKGLEKSA